MRVHTEDLQERVTQSQDRGPRYPTSVQLLVQLYVHQFTDGCSNTNCEVQSCYRHKLQHGSRPPRKLTPTSARALAMHLVSQDKPASQICPDAARDWMRKQSSSRVENKSFHESKDAATKSTTGPKERERDPKAMEQVLSNTQAVKDFFSVELKVTETTSTSELDAGNCSFQLSCPRPDDGAQIINEIQYGPFDASIIQAHHMLLRCVSNLRGDKQGCALSHYLFVASCAIEGWFLDQEYSEQRVRIGCRISEPVISLTKTIVEVLAAAYLPNNTPIFLADCNRCEGTKSFVKQLRHTGENASKARLTYQCLALMIEQVLQKTWNGSTLFHKDDFTGKCIASLDLLHQTCIPAQSRPFEVAFDSAGFFEHRVDAMKAAVALIENSTDGTESLLSRPYLFSARFQADYFRAICLWRMQKAYDDARLLSKRMHPVPGHQVLRLYYQVLSGDIMPTAFYCNFGFTVHRDSILDDALTQLFHREKRELIRPIRINLEGAGEVGQDLGGVAQEFFRLALSKVFEPDYGMFVIDSRTRTAWFDPQSVEPAYRFELLGLLVALAVHNGFTLPVDFPTALYRMLKNQNVETPNGIADGWLELARGLDQLLHWEEGDVSDVFARDYVFSYTAYGRVVNINMKDGTVEDWDNAGTIFEPVTNENREAFVRDYISWLTFESVKNQFQAFKKGFHTIVPPSYLNTVSASVLKRLVEGDRYVDATVLKAAAGYDGGYSLSHPTISNFWSVVEGFGQERMRQLLEFVTASDRVPVSGLQNIDFIIQRNGDDNESLPTSFTCFGRLLLPAYESREKLAEKLNVALDNSQGFGLR